jgi:hypothetical protein
MAARPRPVSSSHVLNGRAAGGAWPGERGTGPGSARRGGWLVRLTFSWDPASPDHAWLTVSTEPSRPGPPSGAWIVPLDVLERGLTSTVTAGSVSLRPARRGAGSTSGEPPADAPRDTDGAGRETDRPPGWDSEGRVRDEAGGSGSERLWVEIRHVRGVWSAEVPRRWVQQFLAQVRAMRAGSVRGADEV